MDSTNGTPARPTFLGYETLGWVWAFGAAVRKSGMVAVLVAAGVGAGLVGVGLGLADAVPKTRLTRGVPTHDATLTAARSQLTFTVDPAKHRAVRVHARTEGGPGDGARAVGGVAGPAAAGPTEAVRLVMVNFGDKPNQQTARVVDLADGEWVMWEVPVRYGRVRIDADGVAVPGGPGAAAVRVFVVVP